MAGLPAPRRRGWVITVLEPWGQEVISQDCTPGWPELGMGPRSPSACCFPPTGCSSHPCGTGGRVNVVAAPSCAPALFRLWRKASERLHESQATPLPPYPLGQRLLQPFTHTNKNKSRCRPLNSAEASFPLAPRASWSCERGLGTLPADLALSLPAHPVSFSHRAARGAEWDVTTGTGVARSCQESDGYEL